jgi:hypothetical protein
MAKGKFKASAEKRIEGLRIESLQRRIDELIEENKKLREQATQDHMHHAFQIAQMHEQMVAATSPRVQELEEENLKLKKALRGA